jgi:hypothetical protein
MKPFEENRTRFILFRAVGSSFRSFQQGSYCLCFNRWGHIISEWHWSGMFEDRCKNGAMMNRKHLENRTRYVQGSGQFISIVPSGQYTVPVPGILRTCKNSAEASIREDRNGANDGLPFLLKLSS